MRRYEGPWRGIDDLGLGTLSRVHWFNGTRPHGSIGHVQPIEYETEYYRQNTARQQPPRELALHRTGAIQSSGRVVAWLLVGLRALAPGRAHPAVLRAQAGVVALQAEHGSDAGQVEPVA